MPNQTPHTPSNQTPSPAEGRGLGGGLSQKMKPITIPPEMQDLVKKINELASAVIPELEKSEEENRIRELEKQQEFIEVAGYKLEKENLGRPQNPEIEINQKQANETIPQAWEYNGNWYYNFLGAQAEAKFLGKEIPTAEQWQKISAPYGQDGGRLSKELNIPMLDYHNWYTGFSDIRKLKAYYWSSTLNLGGAGGLVFTTATISSVSSHGRSNGFSVRCIFPEKEEIQEWDHPPF